MDKVDSVHEKDIISISKLDKNELSSLISIIGIKNIKTHFKNNPRNFQRIIPGMRPKSLTEKQIQEYLFRFRNDTFIINMIIFQISPKLKAMYQSYTKYETMYQDSQKAMIQTLYESPFRGNPALYFKVTNKKYSEEYIELLKTVLSFPEIKFSGENTGKSKDFENLEKEFQRLQNMLKLKSTELARITELYEKQNEIITQNQQKINALETENQELKEKSGEISVLQGTLTDIQTEIENKTIQREKLSAEIDSLSAEFAAWEEEKVALEAKISQLHTQLEEEIRKLSETISITSQKAETLKNTAEITNVNQSPIYIELPEHTKNEITQENELLSVHKILSHNLFVAGIREINDELSKILLSAVCSHGNIIFYGSCLSEIADAISLSIFAEYAAHIVFPVNISDIPYYIQAINHIERRVIFIENAIDSFSDRLCCSLIRYCKDKIFLFAVNDYESLKCLNRSFVFERGIYLNVERYLEYTINHDYQANMCTKPEFSEIGIDKALKEVKKLLPAIEIHTSALRYIAHVTAVYNSIFNIKSRKSIVAEFLMYLMLNDSICNGSAEKFEEILDENDKLEILNTLLLKEEEE